MDKIENALYKVLSYICGILIFAMTVLIFSQVVCRYVMNNSLTWSEELGRYIFVWITFIGLPVALKAKAHVALDLLLKKVHGKTYLILLTINAIFTSILSIVIFYSGLKLVLLGVGQISSAIQLPMQYVYIVIPFSGLLLLFFTIRVFLEERANLLKDEGK